MLLHFAILLIYFCFCDVTQYPGYNGPQKREWSVQLNNYEIKLTSKTSDNGIQDEFRFKLRVVRDSKWILSSDFQYSKTILENFTRSDLQFSFDLFNVVEFKINDSNPIFVGDDDTIVTTWPTQGKQLEYTFWNKTENETVDGVLRQAWETSSLPDKEGKTMTIRVHVDQLIANGTHVKFLPNSVKYDIEFDNWKYSGPFNSRIALITRVSSLTSSSGLNCSDDCLISDDNISFSDTEGHPLGVFSWDKTIKADDTNVPVVAYVKNSSKDQDQNLKVLFTFKTLGHPSSLHWDPLQGLNYPYSPPNSLSPGIKFLIVFVVLMVALLCIGSIYLLVRRYAVKEYNVIN